MNEKRFYRRFCKKLKILVVENELERFFIEKYVGVQRGMRI